MKNTLQLSFFLLIGLTLFTGILSYFNLISSGLTPLLFMGIALVKFSLVAFEFMELRKAHGFWKIATLLIGLILAGGIAFFAFQ